MEDQSLLFSYVLGNKLEPLEKLLHKNSHVELDEKDGPLGQTSLHYACSAQHHDIAKLLLMKGASPDIPNIQSLTPLHYAAKGGDVPTIQLLIKKGANVKAPDIYAHHPLHYAAMYGNKEACLCLVDKGASINAESCKNFTPLHFAALAGHRDVVFALLERGANFNLKNSEGNTALSLLPFSEREIPQPTSINMLNTLTSLSSDFRFLFLNQRYADVYFELEEGRIPSHRNVLCARSPYFRDPFFKQEDKQSEPAIIRIDDVAIKVMNDFLEYLYTGSIQRYHSKEGMSSQEMKQLLEVLNLGQEYQVNSLAEYMEEVVSVCLSKENVGSFLDSCRNAREEVFAGKLKSICARFLVKNHSACLDSLDDLSTSFIQDMLEELEIETISTFSKKHTPSIHRKKEIQKSSDPSFAPLQGKLLVEIKGLLKLLQGDKNAIAFNEPVDPLFLGIPDYFYVIPNPMDLGTIKKRLESLYYDIPESFANDIRLTFRNAQKYNQSGSDIYKTAEKLLKNFEVKYRALLKDFAEKANQEGEGETEVVMKPKEREREKGAEKERSRDTNSRKRNIESISNGEKVEQSREKRIASEAKSVSESKSKAKGEDRLEKPERTEKKKEIETQKNDNQKSKDSKAAGSKVATSTTTQSGGKKYPPPMTYDQKKELGNKINMLNSDQLAKTIQIIESYSKLSSESEDIEVDMNDLNDETLWELYFYVLSCLPNDKELLAFNASVSDDNAGGRDDKKKREKRKEGEEGEEGEEKGEEGKVGKNLIEDVTYVKYL